MTEHAAGKSHPSSPCAAVGGVVLRAGRVLLVRRRDPPHAGEWAIPGGRVRLGESLQHAAEREVLEETGVQVKAGRPIFAFDAIERDAFDAVAYHYVVVDLLAEYVAGEPIPRDDALDARWVSPEELPALRVNATTLRLLQEVFGGRWKPR